MTFEVRVQGQPVYKEEAQVIGVSVQSARGELYRAGISTEGVIDIRLQTVNPGDPIRLDQLEEAQRRWNAEIVQGQATGTPPLQIGNDMMVRQQADDSTLRPGGVQSNQPQQDFGPPSRDLSEGLDPRDSEALTRRIEAYGQHGDADRAIDEVGPTDANAPTTAEQGATPAPNEGLQPPQPSPTGQVLTPGGVDLNSVPPPESTPPGPSPEGLTGGGEPTPAGGATPDQSQPGGVPQGEGFNLSGPAEPQPNAPTS